MDCGDGNDTVDDIELVQKLERSIQTFATTLVIFDPSQFGVRVHGYIQQRAIAR